MFRQLLSALILGLLVAGSSWAADADAEPITVLIVDGQNNHDYTLMSAFMRDYLLSTGRYAVDVTTSPPANAPQEDWDNWRPNFSDYDVVLSNYNGQFWPDPVRASFDEYVRHGGSVLEVHAANNAFPGWTEYEQMTGLLWRGANDGARLYYDAEDNLVRQEPGEGPGAGHGAQHPFQIRTRDPDNPIMQGLPEVWLHATDELYHGQRGPAENMHILATAYSDPATGGTGEHELMMWWIPYGEGKVLTNVMGHVWGGQGDRPALRCVGFLTLLDRSCEWLATGEVTSEVPANFPTADEMVVIDNPTDQPIPDSAQVGAVSTAAASEVDAEGYTVIFDADHTDGWKQAGPGGFTIEDGVATPHGGMGLWWYSGEAYGDFSLKLEFNMDDMASNSGVFLRFPDPGDDPWVAVNEGFEVQIAGDTVGDAHTTGAIYDKQAATSIPIRMPGEWNEYEIRCEGNMVYVTLNGELVNEYQFDGTAEGYIGIQNHSDADVVHFRNVRVKPL